MTARDRTTVGIRRRNLSGRVRQLVLAALGVGLVLVMWTLAAAATEPVRIPSPILVFEAISQNLVEIRALEFASFGSGGIIQNLTYTAVNVLMGVAAGAVAGFAIGLLIGRVRVMRNLLEPPLLFVGTVPVLVLLPFLSLWFGTARLATNGMVIFYTMVTVAVVTQQATTNVSNYYDNYALSLGASSTRVLLQVVRPAVIPEVLGAVRVALAFGWGFQAIAEVLGGQIGAGRVIRVYAQYAATAEILSIVFSVGILAVVIDGIVAGVGRWVVRWQE
ncbi:MAG: ABC transporter permease subunit [bacterium]|nr:ABC transporter permease subunit [bacterium]MDE0288873.1 ABC transporter permease subunit [bacterium]MDE0439765.1 ABC transporter permease subunit [bacterium]